MTFKYNAENVFHFAIVVPEIERGMEMIAKQFSVSFGPPIPTNAKFLIAGREVDIAVRFTYSRQGPPYIELVQAVQGTVFAAATGGSPVHHIGVFVEDMEAEVARLTNEGFDLEFQSIGRDGRLGANSFINSELGVRTELVTTELRGLVQALTNR